MDLSDFVHEWRGQQGLSFEQDGFYEHFLIPDYREGSTFPKKESFCLRFWTFLRDGSKNLPKFFAKL